jgi:ketosteroid isomerase-like protein
VQYQLDNHSTVEQVIASDAEIRIAAPATDHYLVCDRTGECATIEFLEGKLVYHTGESLPVKVLTNSTYQESVSAWKENELDGSRPQDNSPRRFATAANRVGAFEPSSSDAAVTYAFDTLEAVARDDTVWSFVYDPVNLRVRFRTKDDPRIRYLELAALDFSCRTPVSVMDVHADVSGDVSDDLVAYTHAASLAHSTSFFSQYQGAQLSPFLVDALLWGLEAFPCQGGDLFPQADLVRYRPSLPPTAIWAGLTVLHRVGPAWILLTVLSVLCLVWHMQLDQPASLGKRLVWVLVTILAGPFGLLAYLLARRQERRVGKGA